MKVLNSPVIISTLKIVQEVQACLCCIHTFLGIKYLHLKGYIVYLGVALRRKEKEKKRKKKKKPKQRVEKIGEGFFFYYYYYILCEMCLPKVSHAITLHIVCLCRYHFIFR